MRSIGAMAGALLAVIVSAAALLAIFASATHATPRKPSIIFILADDLGYGHPGCYGQKQIRTPHIDRLARQGMRFTQAYAGSRVCAPSRSVLMTGLHSGHTPIRANGGGMYYHPDDITVAEVLREAGYATGGFGKWGGGIEGTPGHPNRQGFDEFFGQLHQVHAHFYYPYYVWRNETKYPLPGNENGKRGQYVHDEIHAKALDFIRRHRDRPFFAYLPYIIPHVELVVPEDSERPYRGKFPRVSIPDPRKGYIGSDDGYVTLAGMISRLDRHVGEILDLLAKLGIDEHTVVFFSSDNGPQGGPWRKMTDFFNARGPLRGYKGTFYEGGIRVPLIARWPGKIAPGTVSHHVCAFWDFLPTAAEIAGVDAPVGIDGMSFLPTLLGKGQQREHRFLYWEYPRGKRLERAVRMGRWKAVQPGAGAPIQLYDLEQDVGETRDLAGQHLEIVKKISEYLATARTEGRVYPVEKPRSTVGSYVR